MDIQEKDNFSVYDGMINDPVWLEDVTPTLIIPKEGVEKSRNKQQSVVNGLKYRNEMSYLGKEYGKIVMPCIPAGQHTVSQYRSQPSLMPLVKVPYQTKTSGICSGKRSAILRQHQRLLRYKGCGNLVQGFNIENEELRGCHFYHTGLRELYMTEYMNEVLRRRLQIEVPANSPILLYNYPQSCLHKAKVSAELPLIGKYCAVFETQGDRRVGTHLISALEILHLLVFEHEDMQWKGIFDEKGRIDEGEVMEFVTNFELMMEEGKTFMQVYQHSQQLQNYVHMDSNKFVPAQSIQDRITQLVEKQVPVQWQERAKDLLGGIEDWHGCIRAIVRRIGWEMGEVKRVMCEEGISWGFFNDHGTQWHSNAHLNNFIITKPKPTTQHRHFILPLDYDLAYTKEEFICIEKEHPHYGQADSDLFENYLCAEYNVMEISLFGLEVMDFKYAIQDNTTISDNLKMGRVCFRDTLVHAFVTAMRNKEEEGIKIREDWDRHIGQIERCVEGCLWLSIRYQT